MKSTQVLILSLLVLVIGGCSKESPENPLPGGSDFTTELIVPDGSENYLNNSSDYIFDQDVLHSFYLEIPSANYSQLNNNPAAEQYLDGKLIFEGDTISPVGVRYKGSIGGFVGCVSSPAWWDPSGEKTCTKLSMKVKINWQGREERFFNLNKLQFHSMNLDESQMHDRLGYWLFREMGVEAPRAKHAKLYINNVYSGLYSLVEQIDGRFAKYNFDDDDGNLYKEIWPLNQSGNAQSDLIYRQALKTNESDTTSVKLMRSFANELSNANTSEIKGVIEKYMDIDKILNYWVVDRTIRHDDGPYHWYCGDGNCSNHNFYWYEEPNQEQMSLIPWDLDNAFENIISGQNSVTEVKDEWGETRNNCQPFGGGFLNPAQISASCDKLIAGWAAYEKYEDMRLEFIEGVFSEANVSAKLDEWTAQIKEATQDAEDIHGDAINIEDWESAMEELKEQLEFARNK